MARSKTVRAAATTEEVAPAGLIRLGVLAALVLPFLFYSAASDEAVRESKLLLLAAGAALALLGLARERELPALGRAWILPVGALVGLVALSALASAGRRLDPLTLVALAAPVPLLLAGASRGGTTIAGRALPLLSICGAATGALATLQRFAGVLRMPIAATEPRFFATGLVGNPGDVAAALVVPALLLWHRVTATSGAARAWSAAGFAAVLAGVGSTESIGPLLAIGAGIAFHLLLDPRRRWKAVALAALLGLAATIPTGGAGRAFRKWQELRSGDVSRAFTQRDIGVRAALQMIRTSPLLGVGPGGFESAFVPARLEAEARLGHRFVHESDSAHFENAHSEPLDVAAECGLPAAALCLGLVAVLLVALVRRRGEDDTGGDVPADLLATLLLAFAVLSAGSFVLRMPPALGPAAFLAGLGLRRAGAVRDASPPPRGLLGAAALLLALLAAARFAAVWLQARGEMALRSIGIAGAYREQVIADARRHLELSVRLRPRKPTALLELGSAMGASGDPVRAWDLTLRSLLAGERAETDVALGLLAFARGDAAEARDLFVRGVWILPKAVELLPPEADPGAVEAAVAAREKTLASGGTPPALPAIAR